MKVVYQPDLVPLARALGAMGFEMHPLGADVAADAVLFTSLPGRALHARPAPGGALLLNVRGLNAAETARALRRRAQTPLF